MDKETFMLNDVLGLSSEQMDRIIADARRLVLSDMDNVEIIKEFSAGCDPYSVAVGFKLATIYYLRANRLIEE